MAKIELPLLSASATGKLAGVVFFRRGDFGINVARLKVTPANPKSDKQTAVRTNVSALTYIWKNEDCANVKLMKRDPVTDTWSEITIDAAETFTSTDKQAWDGYYVTSKKGYKIDGRLAFLSENLTRLYNGYDPLKTPTTTFTLASP